MLNYFYVFAPHILVIKKNQLIFGAVLNHRTMEFAQYLGFLAFLTILTIGFWLMMFLVSFVFYWVGGATVELIKEKRNNRPVQ